MIYTILIIDDKMEMVDITYDDEARKIASFYIYADSEDEAREIVSGAREA